VRTGYSVAEDSSIVRFACLIISKKQHQDRSRLLCSPVRQSRDALPELPDYAGILRRRADYELMRQIYAEALRQEL
jgi:hypothetical protein